MSARLVAIQYGALLAVVVTFLGCASNSKKSTGNNTQKQVDPQQVQSATMAFANRYIAATSDMYDRIKRDSNSSEVRLMAVRGKLIAATGAIANAVDLNPLVGLMDMTVMVTINRTITEQQPWIRQTYGPANVAIIAAVLKMQEEDIWNVASFYLTPDQIVELHKLCAQWLEEHPDQRFAMDVRLTDFKQAAQANRGGMPIVGSVFRLVTLDPFGGLDPAVREVEQSRVLAERMFFYFRNMPTLVAWQTDSLYLQMLQAPEATKLFADTSTVAGSTTRFTESTSKFADVSGRFADTIEKFRVQLPQQQSKLMEDMNQLVATQRDAALRQATTQVSFQRDEAIKQATTQISFQRDETIKQINATASAQQEMLTNNLRTVINGSIDRMYTRAWVLVLIAVGSTLAAFLIYRFIVGLRFGRQRETTGKKEFQSA